MGNDILIGVDIGGTHTDGVALERGTGTVLKKLKVVTEPDILTSIESTLRELLTGLDGKRVSRVALSTTLVTNAVVTKRLEPVGMIITAGPGMDLTEFFDDPNFRVIPGAIDHRGREIVPLDISHAENVLSSFSMKGISVVAVAGKFSVRNPDHEHLLAKLADKQFEYVASSHALSGSLNFPRRAATAYLSAGVWRRHMNFIVSAKKSAAALSITAPLYLLRADGGAQAADSFKNAAEAALSGPSASIMGIMAMEEISAEAIGLDIGGTTTDISFYVNGAPLVEHGGATIGDYLTQIRSLFNRSIAAGGDSEVRVEEGQLNLGPLRRGPAAALGGTVPTPTDAMVVLGRADGDHAKAHEALSEPAKALNLTVNELSEKILDQLAEKIASEVHGFLQEINRRPVYTIHELLQNHRVNPRLILLVGGPAKGLAPYLEKAFGLPVKVPAHYEVANAIGAAVASLNMEINGTADTAQGMLAIPEAEVHRKVEKSYSLADLKAEAKEHLTRLAILSGGEESSLKLDVAEEESFNIIEDYGFAGAIHRVKIQVRPSIICRVGGDA